MRTSIAQNADRLDAKHMAEHTYSIVRFNFKAENEVIQTGLTLEEAQEWCNHPGTHGEGWFDGWRREDEDDDE